MPEGDTIWRAARALASVLDGRTLRSFSAPRLVATGPLPGTTIRSVEARGKHLLVHFDDAATLHTHMLMTGSWHVYRAGERWRRPHHQARVVLETDDGTVAVCFAAPVVELLTTARGSPPAAPAAAGLDDLGPDLCRAAPDLDEVMTRVARVPADVDLASVLLDQRVACGIGNVYKSEVCFAIGIDPATPIGAVSPELRRRLWETAHRFLRANLTTAKRTTVPGVPGGLAVYGHAGRGCRRCHTALRRRMLGRPPRGTYWCPTCQRAIDGATG